MVTCMVLAGISYALSSAFAQRWGPRRPDKADVPASATIAPRMGPQSDSATSAARAALSGYAYAYRTAWRFS
jgi:hypothetical protein